MVSYKSITSAFVLISLFSLTTAITENLKEKTDGVIDCMNHMRTCCRTNEVDPDLKQCIKMAILFWDKHLSSTEDVKSLYREFDSIVDELTVKDPQGYCREHHSNNTGEEAECLHDLEDFINDNEDFSHNEFVVFFALFDTKLINYIPKKDAILKLEEHGFNEHYEKFQNVRSVPHNECQLFGLLRNGSLMRSGSSYLLYDKNEYNEIAVHYLVHLSTSIKLKNEDSAISPLEHCVHRYFSKEDDEYKDPSKVVLR